MTRSGMEKGKRGMGRKGKGGEKYIHYRNREEGKGAR